MFRCRDASEYRRTEERSAKAQIHNGQVIWCGSDGDGHERQIFYWNSADPTIYQLTDNTWDDKYPQIWNSQITWYSKVDGGDYEIMEAHVPEPGTMALFALGLVGLGAKLRRRKVS